MKKRSTVDRDHRLSSSVNPRFDVVAPKRELENAEKQIEKVRKEAQKAFEREKKQLVKKLVTLPTTKFLQPETAARKTSRVPSTSDETSYRKMSTTSAGIASSEFRSRRISAHTSPDVPPWLHGTASKSSLTPDALVPKHRKVKKSVTASQKSSRAWLFDRKSSTDTDDGRRTPKTSMGFGGQRSSICSGAPDQVGTPTSMEFHGPPSQAVQLMSMIRFLALNQPMDAKQMKALTSVIEESRTAVKSVKSGMDPERAQEKLVKKLTELLDLVKPHGSDLIISPEELLRCSYLRMSTDNVKCLEQMIRDKGFEPGIHYHSDIQDYLDKLDSDTEPTEGIPLSMGEADNLKSFQPVSIYQTKAGAPMDRTRTSKPGCVPGPSAEEEMARLKKFRAV